MKVRNKWRAVGMEVRGQGSRSRWEWGRQQIGGCGMHVCSQPCVTANSRAASREANVLSNRNTRQ
jgi:hypothetical protein